MKVNYRTFFWFANGSSLIAGAIHAFGQFEGFAAVIGIVLGIFAVISPLLVKPLTKAPKPVSFALVATSWAVSFIFGQGLVATVLPALQHQTPQKVAESVVLVVAGFALAGNFVLWSRLLDAVDPRESYSKA